MRIVIVALIALAIAEAHGAQPLNSEPRRIENAFVSQQLPLRSTATPRLLPAMSLDPLAPFEFELTRKRS